MMSSSRLLITAAIALPLLALTAGCVVEPARPPHAAIELAAPKPPPPPRYEVAPPPPPDRAERVVWDPGHWRWDGHDWDWVPGHFVERPHREAHWEPGHWQERPNGAWVWIDGEWR
jgi:hypothetical protein